ncbi:MAG: GAF domain-containing protein, partial [Candidatus Zixiibacteriota bacterium]
MFLFDKLLSHFFASEYSSKLELFVGGICLVLASTIMIFFTRKILSPLRRLVRKAETICCQVDKIETAPIQLKNDIDRLERSLDLLAQNLKEREERINHLDRRLSAINVIATAVKQPRNTDQMFGDVLETTLEVTGFDWGIMYLLDEGKNSLRVKAWRGIGVEKISELDQIKLGEGIFGQAAQKEQIVFVPDVEKDDRAQNSKLKDKKTKSIVAVPLVAKGEVFGVVALGSLGLKDLTLEENEFLEGIFGQVGMAIDNINLLVSWAKKTKDLSLLLDISYAVSSSLDLGQVLEVLSQRMAEIAGAEVCYIALLDENRKDLRVEVAYSAQKRVDFIGKKREFSLELVPHHREVIETGRMAKIMGRDEISPLER